MKSTAIMPVMSRVAFLASALAVSLIASSPAAQQSLPSGPLAIRAFTLRFDPAGTFALSGDGWPSMAGTWTTSGREVTLQSQTGPDACTGAGRYTFSIDGARVSFNLIADVAYVGNAARHQQIQVDLNGRPYGYAYLPSSLDPTVVVGGQAQPLSDDFLRPYQGFGRIQERRFAGSADYHALQLSVNRRRSSDGLSLGAA